MSVDPLSEDQEAALEFDPRTAFRNAGGIKSQEQWLRCTFDVLANRESNLQVDVGLMFPYDRSQAVRSPDFARLVAGSWCATAPVLALIRETPDAPTIAPVRARPKARSLPRLPASSSG
jgi:hypothetical protein